jgi:hypothetical protein
VTIKVKVYAPGFINHDAIDPNGFIELDENDSIKTLYQKLKIPFPFWPIVTCCVNYEQAKLSTTLKDEDVVTFLFPFPGG